MNVRDNLTMQVLGFRQIIRDMPEEQLPSARVLLRQVEEELIRLKEKKR